MKLTTFVLTLSFCIISNCLFAQPSFDKSFTNKTQEPVDPVILEEKIPQEPQWLEIFKNGYPDCTFESEYDEILEDWKITVSVPRGEEVFTRELYWSNGSFLPLNALSEKESHWTLLYNYAKTLRDPATFSVEEIESIRQFSSPDNRRNGSGTPQYFFDTIYDCETQIDVEKHIKKTTFFGKPLNVHERIIPILKKVETEITELAKTDSDTKAFVDQLYQVEGYLWRTIRDTNRKSFHSIGIAVDVLPVRWGHKIIYWNWQAQIDPENWMLTPLSDRWMPSQGVISIFENNGFIWGGKWGIWDNMHFEFHPEIILFQRSKG